MSTHAQPDSHARQWRLTLCLALVVFLMAAIVYATAQTEIDAIRLVIRTTARTSLALFLVAFTASSFAWACQGPVSTWILKNRRSFGLAFAFSHLLHLMAIFSLANRDPDLFWSLSGPPQFISGGIAYVFIALLAATSFDWIAALLGPKHFARLHMLGSWYIVISFIVTNGKRIPVSPFYAIPVCLLIIAVLFKIFVKLRLKTGAPRGSVTQKAPA